MRRSQQMMLSQSRIPDCVTDGHQRWFANAKE
jgi:hypothetical protein